VKQTYYTIEAIQGMIVKAIKRNLINPLDAVDYSNKISESNTDLRREFLAHHIAKHLYNLGVRPSYH
jgi:hypothetical protein